MTVDLEALRRHLASDPLAAALWGKLPRLPIKGDTIRVLYLLQKHFGRDGQATEWASVCRVLAAWEAAGLGLLAKTQNRHLAHFRFSAHHRDVSESLRRNLPALPPSAYFREEDRRRVAAASRAAGSAASALAPGWAEHRVRLRPALEVTFRLPNDLTDREAMRLGHFLRALPLDRPAADEPPA